MSILYGLYVVAIFYVAYKFVAPLIEKATGWKNKAIIYAGWLCLVIFATIAIREVIT